MKQIFCILMLLTTSYQIKAQCPDTTYGYDYVSGTNDRFLKRRELTTYDDQRKQVEFIQQNFVNNIWVNNYKESKSYFTNGAQKEIITYTWQNNAWINSEKGTTTQNAAEQIIESISYKWLGNVWVNELRTQYSYDVNGNKTEEFTQKWINAAWENYFRTNFTYNNSNKVTQYIQYYLWENNAWTNRIKYDYTLNPAGYAIKTMISKWDNNSSLWKYSRKDSNIYNSSNLLLFHFYSDFQNSKWIKNGKLTYTYNAVGKETQLLSEDWDIIGNKYVNEWKRTYQYNSFGYEIEYLYQNYDITLAEWEPSGKTITEYDENNNIIVTEGFAYWNAGGGFYDYRNRTEYKYCAKATEITPITMTQPKLYPNPVYGEELTLEVVHKSNFVIINMCGKAMLNGVLDVGKTSINTQDFPSGIYLIKIGDCIQKLIKP